AGVMADFDIGSDPTTNTSAADTVRRAQSMRQASTANPTVGVKILAPRSFANLSAVDHARYVYPDSCMTDGQKWRFLNGTVVQRNSNRNYDWSTCTSVGPFDIQPGSTYRCAFAFLGGTSLAEFQAYADSAQSWYDGNVGVLEPDAERASPLAIRLSASPNPFRRTVTISYHVPLPGRVLAQVFDISGRTVATLTNAELPAGKTQATWSPKGLVNGVYLLKLQLPDGTATEKLMLLR
ncbi:T9SS type A sorting domain-containing protein, partial [candidate division WOR-3 bacterium]|nr:T9SS type A sorting domain-containing protein [candidate division WOR-3 bacterium]